VERDADVDVLYEDEWLLAVDKPAGVIVHDDGTGAATLTDLVRAHLEGEGRDASAAQAVQRLDRETTGVMLFSLDKTVQPRLDTLVAKRELHKRYLAVVSGLVPWECQRFDGPIARDRHDSHRMRVGDTGKPAETRAVCLARSTAGGPRGHSLLLVELRTGRRHQIRVHLSTAGCPIAGDALYAGERVDAGLMLHAFDEELVHPVTGKTLHVRAPWPARFDRWFDEGAVANV
jgi:23S rRNA pseudouridine1911/1915/1917 synthase